MRNFKIKGHSNFFEIYTAECSRKITQGQHKCVWDNGLFVYSQVTWNNPTKIDFVVAKQKLAITNKRSQRKVNLMKFKPVMSSWQDSLDTSCCHVSTVTNMQKVVYL
jgi:hypothetical protein